MCKTGFVVGRGLAGALVAVVVLAASPCASAQNSPPATPTILEPQAGRPLDPADVHMETAPFSDPNAGQTHACSDFEIWTLDPLEPVWVAPCLSGAIAVHTHLGDGTFINSLNQRRQLDPETTYLFRVRHKDSSNDPASEWSEWATREFITGSLSQVYALELHDIAQAPVPQLVTPQGQPFSLPNSASSNKAEIRVTAACCGSPLLTVRAGSNGNILVNPPPLGMHMPLKVTVQAGSDALALPELDLQFVGGNGKREQILLPSLALSTTQSVSYWVASEGSTYVIEAGQTEPTFTQVARRNRAPWNTTPDMKVSVFAQGLRLPVSMAMLSNPGTQPSSPLMYVAELYGDVKVISRNGTVSDFAPNLLNFNPFGGFPGSGEGGIGGLAVQPGTGDVFVSMLSSYDPERPDLLTGRVQRIMPTNNGASAGSITTILDLAPFLLAPSHQISNLFFLPDGSLLVHVGDGFEISVVQDLDDPRGKILRLSPEGMPLPNNPFYDANDGISIRDYIYTRGHRNPFGGDRRPFDNTYWVLENGPGVDRLGLVLPGRNFGYDGTDASMATFATFVWQPAVAPVDISFLSNSAARFFNSGFPSSYAGRGYVTLSGSTWATGPGTGGEKAVIEMQVNFSETLQAVPRAVATYAGSGKASCSAIAVGPDGIYFADLYKDDEENDPTARGAQILLLSYQPPPDCNANALADIQETISGTTNDCNWNLVPDSCDVLNQFATDCNSNGVLDECETTDMELTAFATAPGEPWYINGGAQLTGDNTLLLDNVLDGDEGSLIRDPLRATPLSRLQASFDFRMGGDLQQEGFSFTVFEAARSSFIFFGEDGANNAPLTVKFDLDNTLPGGPGVVSILRDGIIRETVAVGALGDGQWRTARLSVGTEGLTLTLTRNGVTTPVYVGEVVDGYVPLVAKIGFGARKPSASAFYEIDNVIVFTPNSVDGEDQDYRPESCDVVDCDSIDFNNDNSIFDPQDIEAFLSVYSEGPCVPPTATCNDIDFNNDSSIFDPEDIAAFLRVYAEGPCRL